MGNGNNQGNMMNPEQEKLWEKYKLAELAGSTSSPQAARIMEDPPSPRLRRASPDDYVFTYEVTREALEEGIRE
jgi:hypothetical protein